MICLMHSTKQSAFPPAAYDTSSTGCSCQIRCRLWPLLKGEIVAHYEKGLPYISSMEIFAAVAVFSKFQLPLPTSPEHYLNHHLSNCFFLSCTSKLQLLAAAAAAAIFLFSRTRRQSFSFVMQCCYGCCCCHAHPGVTENFQVCTLL